LKIFYLLKLISVSIAVLLVVLFSRFTNSIDSSISRQIIKLSGQSQPDSNIVLITITSEDIEQIGPWPIKRSYYALLIQELNKFKVKKIGLEVFLSTKFATQSLYDNVLVKEINKSNKVVLSSLTGEIKIKNEQFISDEFRLPSPKLLENKIVTGHINYLKDRGFVIPIKIKALNTNEYAFSAQIAANINGSIQKIKINFRSSWNSFKHYSLVEFFQLVQSNDPELKSLQNKYVLIGVTDPQLAQMIETTFDDEMPGIALHAFALDNLLNSSYIKTNYYFISKIVFGLIILLFAWLVLHLKENYKWYLITITGLFVFSVIIQQLLYIEISYIAFLLPFFVLILVESFVIVNENRNQLKGFYNEAELVKNLLAEKERTLESLQRELNISNQNSSTELISKIRGLKEDIERLKDNEEDKLVAEGKGSEDVIDFYGLVYRSSIMKNIVELIKKSAPTDATILVTGESGTGKELVARSIHALSKRKEQKIIAINCAALTESLLESELFGHVKGSFTGAISDKAGKFELANNGTIFLDEIGETSENFQVKLLRVLQSGEYDKVGSTATSITNVRVIAATNKDIKQRVKENKFREDLFYRLNVIEIHLPSLSDRKEDIEAIANYFLQTDEKKYQISSAALKSLIENNWKGNVRELESVIKRAKVFCDAAERDIIQLNDLPAELTRNVKLNFEDLVIESLRNKKFSHSAINETAKELGNINRTIISENFRGLAFKYYVENNFDQGKAIFELAKVNDEEVLLKIKSKMDTWISNIKKDLDGNTSIDFNSLKKELSSKYKNLPQKFHIYLDEVIKYLSIKK
jgi:DNA-binding NtrC family response regulator/CHASE2 domain-containing sensor protein